MPHQHIDIFLRVPLFPLPARRPHRLDFISSTMQSPCSLNLAPAASVPRPHSPRSCGRPRADFAANFFHIWIRKIRDAKDLPTFRANCLQQILGNKELARKIFHTQELAKSQNPRCALPICEIHVCELVACRNCRRWIFSVKVIRHNLKIVLWKKTRLKKVVPETFQTLARRFRSW